MSVALTGNPANCVTMAYVIVPTVTPSTHCRYGFGVMVSSKAITTAIVAPPNRGAANGFICPRIEMPSIFLEIKKFTSIEISETMAEPMHITIISYCNVNARMATAKDLLIICIFSTADEFPNEHLAIE